jgi:hydrogenase-4 component E
LPQLPNISAVLIGSIFMSFFLTFNRKSALSQLIGVLSLENCIFVMSRFLDIHELLFLEIGLLFDVFFWIIVASTFAHIIYRHYGSFEMTKMQSLKK